MAITLNGTTGITTPDITSEAGLTVDGVSFASGAPANTLVTTSGGNVGIGTASPTYPLTVYGASQSTIEIESGSDTGEGRLYFTDPSTTAIGGIEYQHNGDFMRFYTNNAERARIDSSGNLLVGTTTPFFNTSGAGNGVQVDGSLGIVSTRRNSTTASTQMAFHNPNGLVGQILTTGSSTSFVTSSDYRLKEDWVAVADASTRVNALKPVNFAWKVDGTRVDGFLAHEVAEVVPEAVTGEKDAVELVDIKDEEGNVTGQEERPVYQGIDQSKLVPLLTAALQEALTKIETLEARVATLEAA